MQMAMFVTSIPKLKLDYSSRKGCSGCLLVTPDLQLAARSSSCGPHFFPIMDTAATFATAMFGKSEMLRIVVALLMLPRARVPYVTEFFLGAAGAIMSGKTACGITQGKKKIWHSVDANMVAAAHTGMRKAQG